MLGDSFVHRMPDSEPLVAFAIVATLILGGYLLSVVASFWERHRRYSKGRDTIDHNAVPYVDRAGNLRHPKEAG